jgi:sugar lactone lactonase YvrE
VLVGVLARDADHTGGVLCALRLNDGDEHAVCEVLADLPLQPNRRVLVVAFVVCDGGGDEQNTTRVRVLTRRCPPPGTSCPNDGKCDARGRLWFGSKARVPQPPYTADASLGGVLAPDPGAPPPPGRLYVAERADGDAQARVRLAPEAGAVTVSNGIGFSPRQDVMYYVDSPSRSVLAFDIRIEDGALSNRRVLADVRALAPPGAVPDGLAVDAEGGVWVALWDGGALLRLSPESGALLRHIQMPVSRPTSCAFGAGTMLYVTSCSFDAGDAAPLAEPLAGAVFALDAGVAGAPVAACRI